MQQKVKYVKRCILTKTLHFSRYRSLQNKSKCTASQKYSGICEMQSFFALPNGSKKSNMVKAALTNTEYFSGRRTLRNKLQYQKCSGSGEMQSFFVLPNGLSGWTTGLERRHYC
jgi:hypothetical protein